jgi:HEPN domain-containing protein
MYHFLVVKQTITDEELEHIAGTIKYEEPTYFTLRRYEEELAAKALPGRLYKRGSDYAKTHGIRRFLRRAPVFAFSLLRRKVTSLISKG